jgi:hypothetical protein
VLNVDLALCIPIYIYIFLVLGKPSVPGCESESEVSVVHR